MATRDELKSLIDQLPESRLAMVREILNHQINPPPPNPDIERMQQRSQNYRRLLLAESEILQEEIAARTKESDNRNRQKPQ